MWNSKREEKTGLNRPSKNESPDSWTTLYKDSKVELSGRRKTTKKQPDEEYNEDINKVMNNEKEVKVQENEEWIRKRLEAVLLEKSDLCDVILEVPDIIGQGPATSGGACKQYALHRLLLSRCSPKYLAYFSSASPSSGEPYVIRFPQHVPEEAVRLVLRFVYGGDVHDDEDFDVRSPTWTRDAILRLAVFLGIDDLLLRHLKPMMVDEGDVESPHLPLSYLVLSDQCQVENTPETKEILFRLAAKHLPRESAEFAALSAEHMWHVIELAVQWKSAEHVFSSVVGWLRHRSPSDLSAAEHLEVLLRDVTLPEVPPDVLKTLEELPGIVLPDPVKRKLCDAYRCHALNRSTDASKSGKEKDGLGEMMSKRRTKENGHGPSLVLIGGQLYNSDDPRSGCAVFQCQLPPEEEKDGGDWSDEAIGYHWTSGDEEGSADSIPDLPHPKRFHCTAVVHGKKLFILGGCGEKYSLRPSDRPDPWTDSPTNEVLCYDCGPLTRGGAGAGGGGGGRWRGVASMSHRRTCFGVAVAANTIYAVGGFGGETDSSSDSMLSSAEFYDCERDTWTPLPELPVPCVAPAATCSCLMAGGSEPTVFMVAGGYVVASEPWNNSILPLATVFLLDVGTKTPPGVIRRWRSASPMPRPLFFASAASSVALDDRVWVVGGATAAATTMTTMESSDLVLEYDIRKDEWREMRGVRRLLTARHAASVLIHGHFLYVIGGFSTDQRTPLCTVETLTIDDGKEEAAKRGFRYGPNLPRPFKGCSACVIDRRLPPVPRGRPLIP